MVIRWRVGIHPKQALVSEALLGRLGIECAGLAEYEPQATQGLACGRS